MLRLAARNVGAEAEGVATMSLRAKMAFGDRYPKISDQATCLKSPFEINLTKKNPSDFSEFQ